jgi:hypothetical protein
LLQLTNAVENRFCEGANAIIDGRTSAVVSHQNTLFKYREDWAKLFSNKTCFACFARRPENTLRCGHSLYDPCIAIHGSSSVETPWTSKIETCPLCNTKVNDIFKTKPPTAGVRVLSIDGGGVRGLASIAWLRELQSVLGLSIPIPDQFDFAIGTSSGSSLLYF